MPDSIMITGTTRGIGKELALHFLEAGATIVGCGRSESTITHEAYHHFQLDVRDEQEIVSMVRTAARNLGGIDALINNAGVASMNHILMTPGATLDEVFSINVRAPFVFTREVAKLMMKKKQGRIVNMSTIAVPLDIEGEAAYASSKAALESFTRIAARELAEFGITVNAVGPTPVSTDLIEGVPQEKIEALLNRQALPRLGTYDDVANVVEFFLNDRSHFVTGQVIYLGGVS